MDKNKLILVYYLDVKDRPHHYVSEMVTEVAKQVKNDKYETIVMPTQEGGNRVECINPVILEGTEAELHLQKLKECSEKFQGYMMEREILEEISESNQEYLSDDAEYYRTSKYKKIDLDQ